MRRSFKQHLLPLFLLIIIGASSQPIIAYAYTLLDMAKQLQESSKVLLFKVFPIILIGIVFSSLNHIGKTYFANKTANSLRKEVFNKLLNRSLSDFHVVDSGEYYNLLSKKIELWKTRSYSEFWNILQNSLEICVIFILIYRVNLQCGVICILFLIPLVINNIFFPKKMDASYNKFVKTLDKMTLAVKEYFNGFDVIKVNHMERIFEDKFSTLSNNSCQAEQKLGLLENISGTVANICVVLSQITGIIFSLILFSKQAIQLGSFLSLVQLTFFLNEPVIRLINSALAFSTNKEINRELNGILNTSKKKEFTTLPKLKSLDFEKVSYNYPNSQKPILKDFSCSLKYGQKYLVLGESGSGKTTFLKLILGAIKPLDGRIYFNGNIHVKDPVAQRLICLVPQEIFVFNDSIKNNIDLLKEQEESAVAKIVKTVRLNSLVESREAGLNGLIGDEICQISGGEKARLALARAIINPAPILLIDEILASLDPRTSYEIEKLILAIENKLVVHISHKSSEELKSQYDDILDFSQFM